MNLEKVSCEICFSKNYSLIQSKGKVGKFGQYGNLNIVQCQRCGHVFQEKKRNIEKNEEFFKTDYHSLNSHYANDQEAIQSQLLRSKGILKYLIGTFPKNKKLLDLGCGYGYIMQNFTQAGYECSGIDPDKSCVDFAQNNSNLDVILGSSENLPYKDANFDIVISLGTLEHVSDLKKSLKEIWRVLSKDGILFLRMRPNRIWGLPYEYFNISTIRYFSVETQLLSLFLNGFSSHLINKEQLEGRNGDIYIAVHKSEDKTPSLDYLIKNGFYDKPGELSIYLKSHYYKLRKKSEELLNLLGSNNENVDSVVKKIESGTLKYPLFTGYTDIKSALLRGIKEAHITIKEPWI